MPLHVFRALDTLVQWTDSKQGLRRMSFLHPSAFADLQNPHIPLSIPFAIVPCWKADLYDRLITASNVTAHLVRHLVPHLQQGHDPQQAPSLNPMMAALDFPDLVDLPSPLPDESHQHFQGARRR